MSQPPVVLVSISSERKLTYKTLNPVETMREQFVLDIFAAISTELIETALRFIRYGIMLELHGQNVLLILRDGQMVVLVLQDHDTVRLHPPWMKQAGVESPKYLIKADTPNTLINDAPEKLLAYFQTLVIQVNSESSSLYSIFEALSYSYAIEESEFWRVTRDSLERSINVVDFPKRYRSVIENELFLNPNWPFKQLNRC
ncbi:MAG: hypothetical protein BRC49_17660 [Cyanobacteria bacterium SW_10_48_33]|jgi:siderophore synthetase component|nr:MAG: hypothetical protein BRC46_01680 [Cyanobacteria bacterium QS_6_48_18]PSP07909.1 MAG: hypothetical protein BRC49_17660 [Cyanobacteria bacterium SW_10_48_33]